MRVTFQSVWWNGSRIRIRCCAYGTQVHTELRTNHRGGLKVLQSSCWKKKTLKIILRYTFNQLYYCSATITTTSTTIPHLRYLVTAWGAHPHCLNYGLHLVGWKHCKFCSRISWDHPQQEELRGKSCTKWWRDTFSVYAVVHGKWGQLGSFRWWAACCCAKAWNWGILNGLALQLLIQW